MADSDLANMAAFYDSRAPTYDDSFHAEQAADYMGYVSPAPGSSWLDLCCGTGLVTLLAAQAVGPSGRVIGVDISTGMLAQARTKAASLDPQPAVLEFLQQDVTDLSSLAARGVTEGAFDTITCASALPNPKDIDATLSHWARYLKPGGRIVVDVPSVHALLNTGMFARIAPRCGLEAKMPDDRRWIRSEASLREKLEGAGLRCERVFLGREYSSRFYRRDDLEAWFEKTVAVPIYEPFREEGRIEVARREWLKEMRKLADENGDVRESMSFYVGTAVKPA